MTILARLKHEILVSIQKLFSLEPSTVLNIEVTLNVEKERSSFGDLSCNAALVLAKILSQKPMVIAQQIQKNLQEVSNEFVSSSIQSVTLAGPGFINITLHEKVWLDIIAELFVQKEGVFKLDEQEPRLKYLIEFVSVNPTGPMHLGSGRNGIIGDVLAKVMQFLGHEVFKEFYINDAGSQIKRLGKSFRVRCIQQTGVDEQLPEDGYAGDYLIDLARECYLEYGDMLWEKKDQFFEDYAKDHLLQLIKADLKEYGIVFDGWFSEKSLHANGAVDAVLELLKQKGLAYEHEGALWFKSTAFGDDKDRVVRKSDGEVTYIAADIAYHKNKFDRGFDRLIDILGQDHHGYVKRLKATMEALGYDAHKLDVILYQLVTIKENDEVVKMSKRSGTFTKLRDILDAVGSDVTRFFYLNRKAEAHLEFDLAVALKKTEENPVFYMQYAHVRTVSLLARACQEKEFEVFVQELSGAWERGCERGFALQNLDDGELRLLKKIISLTDILRAIAGSYQTHLLAYYAWELAHTLHSYYATHRIVDAAQPEVTKMRLLMIFLTQKTLKICLDLLGVSCPEKM